MQPLWIILRGAEQEQAAIIEYICILLLHTAKGAYADFACVDRLAHALLFVAAYYRYDVT